MCIRDRFPTEYNNNKIVPKIKLPFLATIASKVTRIGVEHGLEKSPAIIPNNKAGKYPFLPLLFVSILLGITFITSNVCNAIKINTIAKKMYQAFPAWLKILLKSAAKTPRKVYVIAIPKEKTIETLSAFLVLFSFVPAINPTTSGTDASEQGEIEVKTPPKKANTGANMEIFLISEMIKEITLFSIFYHLLN